MKFKITRSSGKSDAEVLSEVLTKFNPGELVPYSTLSEVLSLGASRIYRRKDVQSAISRSESKLAREHRRALINVREFGYRVALAGEHQMIAGRKKDRAGSLLRRGLTVLQHVDWDAMDPNTRRAHEGQLMVVGALHSAMKGLDSRIKRIEDVIQNRNVST